MAHCIPDGKGDAELFLRGFTGYFYPLLYMVANLGHGAPKADGAEASQAR